MESAITVEDLRFGYDGLEVLHGISFSIGRGEVTGLLGPNGAGKSTTLKILTGILQPRSGRVEVEGCALPSQAYELKQRIGYVPEAAELYETHSALEFLEMCGRLHEIEERSLQLRIDALLEAFGLSGQRRQRLGAYSKGMRQKVLIAAALIHDPALILLDEPLTGLDIDAAVLTKGLLAALAARGKTVLYSSHVLDVVEKVCARVLIIDRGSLIADGSPEELKSTIHKGSLEDVFREVTHAESVEPRITAIIEGLRL
jgi:ABC-2 type transport system ATP-binding protein